MGVRVSFWDSQTAQESVSIGCQDLLRVQSHPGMHPQVIITFFTAAESVKVFSVQGLMNDRRFKASLSWASLSRLVAQPIPRRRQKCLIPTTTALSVRKIIARSKQAIEL